MSLRAGKHIIYGVKDTAFGFDEIDGKYVSTNQRKPDSVANAYVPIDLRTTSGKYKLVVNVTCSGDGSDVGYLTITETPKEAGNGGQLMTWKKPHKAIRFEARRKLCV